MNMWPPLIYLSICALALVTVTIVLAQSKKPVTRDGLPPDAE
jgi:hypothetical protein